MNKKSKTSNLTKEKKRSMHNDETSYSCSLSSTSNSNSIRRVSRVSRRLRNPNVRLVMVRRSLWQRKVQDLALPLGMSFAAFANLVLERKSVADHNVYVDDLAAISASIVRESLANVYGDKLGSFETNFERSFKSTLRILTLINKSSSFPNHLNNNNVSSFNLDSSTTEGSSDTELSAKETSSVRSSYRSVRSSYRPIQGGSMNGQLSIVPRSSTMSSLTTIERSLQEQALANDLKSMEIGLTMRKLKLKETDLALSYESNNLEKSKLEMGVTKAAFRAEKFITKLEDTRKAYMVSRITDWLMVSVSIMMLCMFYGTYVFSKSRIMEATSICESSKEESSAWSTWVPKQVLRFISEINILICRVKELFGRVFTGLMVLIFIYFIIRRSSSTKQTMPVWFIVVLLGIVCGLSGKYLVDTLGGNGKLWLFLWGMFCVLQLLANVFTLRLYGLMYGPISETKASRVVPYWARQCFFYGAIMLMLPMINGLLPFATFGEWRDHISGWGS